MLENVTRRHTTWHAGIEGSHTLCGYDHWLHSVLKQTTQIESSYIFLILSTYMFPSQFQTQIVTKINVGE